MKFIKKNWKLIILTVIMLSSVIRLAIPKEDNNYCEDNPTWVCSWLK
jgi:hypothetical protein